MRTCLLALILLSFTACAEPDDRVQISSGGGFGGGALGGAGGSGGGGGGSGGSTTLSGVVCVAADLRDPTACARTASAGTLVTSPATGAATTTDASGAFTLETGAVGNMILAVGAGSSTTVPTIVRVDVPGAQVTVPVVNANDLTALETGLNTTVPDGTGLVALHIVDTNGAGALGYTITPPPGALGGTFYDDTTALGFAQNATSTGAAGTALITGVPQGAFDIGFANGTSTGTFASVPVTPGAITFANSQIGTP